MKTVLLVLPDDEHHVHKYYSEVKLASYLKREFGLRCLFIPTGY